MGSLLVLTSLVRRILVDELLGLRLCGIRLGIWILLV